MIYSFNKRPQQHEEEPYTACPVLLVHLQEALLQQTPDQKTISLLLILSEYIILFWPVTTAFHITL